MSNSICHCHGKYMKLFIYQTSKVLQQKDLPLPNANLKQYLEGQTIWERNSEYYKDAYLII